METPDLAALATKALRADLDHVLYIRPVGRVLDDEPAPELSDAGLGEAVPHCLRCTSVDMLEYSTNLEKYVLAVLWVYAAPLDPAHLEQFYREEIPVARIRVVRPEEWQEQQWDDSICSSASVHDVLVCAADGGFNYANLHALLRLRCEKTA